MAAAEDEGDVALTLHWRDGGGEHHAPMAKEGDRWAGALPPGRPLTWWVRAVDGRGNQARTADMALPAGC
ncbi:MAG TPA: hypothetical protein VK975_04720, partial [Acidimicrobiales bacterium]|nr:hypothetical protein [Acidimicrobiales bacterium]